ncbi:alpha-amylase family protein [Acidipropionibacterium jensenii]|uniref:Cyclomaltodextrinase n=2 Tax=Acidipropionibacterium jensenii TaxID=1749 RepID=A0A3S4WVK7_9ACTN|nr:alpha-amylase family protein [Acidipropionibacterium jensenii]MDN5977537.1 alpha-amylase family protein [Acidipropionibacterium jensenii]MDN5996085.1 alpha-amylase family protein [Acidipropionibacterium jensenii]MDN6441092.1 alpha-amylase family protein [Acidipropionibacterium jensenii]MDN6480032.1 alpha-amylase family protein [Acidipropionibacterium jensenii]MDN6511993.1 alpha-amylase family protein [Acidipropionibacterium jensenii]
MTWVDHAIWWHVYPLGFCGAPIRDGDRTLTHRLGRLSHWLDYAVELGASGLLLGPIFASESHGYDTLDPMVIDPRLGDEDDFDRLVAGCRDRGLRILLDGVFSHVGSQHPGVIRALAEGPDGPDADLFDIDWQAKGGPAPRVFEGHSSLVRLNHSSDRAVEYTSAVMAHWLERGIDGWRLDAAYSVPTAFWSRVLPGIRERFPQAWFLGEVIHGDYPEFVDSSGVDSVTQYELWKAIWSSLKDRNLFELAWSLKRHNGFLADFTPNTFIGNHDVTRIASTLGADGAVTALAILMTIGGIPSIYYGDEQGFTGVKEERIGGDDDIRPPVPDHPEQLAGWGQDILRAHQDLIGLRRRHPWLTTATTSTLHLENARFDYRSTAADGADFLDVRIDLTATPRATVIDSAGQTLWSQQAADSAAH